MKVTAKKKKTGKHKFLPGFFFFLRSTSIGVTFENYNLNVHSTVLVLSQEGEWEKKRIRTGKLKGKKNKKMKCYNIEAINKTPDGRREEEAVGQSGGIEQTHDFYCSTRFRIVCRHSETTIIFSHHHLFSGLQTDLSNLLKYPSPLKFFFLSLNFSVFFFFFHSLEMLLFPV